jgi:AraC-like DNA-binding protein
MRNPFEQQLRSDRLQPLTSLILESPLPLGEECGKKPGDSEVRLFACNLGALQIIAACGAGRKQVLLARPWISLLCVVEGEVVISQSGRLICGNPGSCVLIPQSSAHWQSGTFSVVCLMLPPQSFGTSILAPVDMECNETGFPRGQRMPREFREDGEGPQKPLLDLLVANLQGVAALQIRAPRLIGPLALANQLILTINTLALLPADDQHWHDQQEPSIAAGMHGSFDKLIAFIQANLDQTLNLAVLEKHTNYSRRALQYAFRERLGCTISQWIRSQRLDRAYQLLRKAEIGDSVGSIALRCGYQSNSLFSIHFQQRFHIKPSHLLRNGCEPC